MVRLAHIERHLGWVKGGGLMREKVRTGREHEWTDAQPGKHMETTENMEADTHRSKRSSGN
jgi:hypothetical protein